MATIKTRADYFKDTKYFCCRNNNPTAKDGKQHDKGDCVIRALAMAADITWLEAFDNLTAEARKTYNVVNDKACYRAALLAYGFTKNTAKAVKGKKRMTIEELCKKHSKGRFFVEIANHCTAVVDGVCYDTWNCANKCVYTYWKL